MKIKYGRGTVRHGFTIVELLIVVVVIAILAAITIVAYNGITTQTKAASVESEIATIQKKLELYRTNHNNMYPDDADSALTSADLQGLGDKLETSASRWSCNITTKEKYCLHASDNGSGTGWYALWWWDYREGVWRWEYTNTDGEVTTMTLGSGAQPEGIPN